VLGSTHQLIENACAPAVFEATLKHGNVLVRVDVLQRQRGNEWRLIEVRSTCCVKDDHLYDIGIQRRIASACDIELSRSCVMHPSREYVYTGGVYDLGQLFRITSVDDRLAELDAEIAIRIHTQFRMLRQPEPR
jgi:hypothetical protein